MREAELRFPSLSLNSYDRKNDLSNNKNSR